MHNNPEYKRFALFEISNYYPIGGISDITKSFDDLNDAISAYNESDHDVRYVFDFESRCQAWPLQSDYADDKQEQ